MDNELLAIIIGLILFISLIGGLAYLVERKVCYSQANMMGVDWDYAFFQGCMWKIENKWISDENYRLFEK